MNRKFFLLISLLVLGVLAACSPAQPQAAVQPKQELRKLEVSGSGVVSITPDVVTIQVGVQTSADSASEAVKQNNALTQAVINAVKEQGVDLKDIQTSSFNVYPVQEHGEKGEVLRTTYRVSNMVTLKVRDLAKLGIVLDKAVAAGANQVYGINFDLLDRSKAITQARKLAIEDARKQASELAEAAGVKLGEIQAITVTSAPSPSPVAMDGRGAKVDSAVPISEGQLQITVQVNVTYEVR